MQQPKPQKLKRRSAPTERQKPKKAPAAPRRRRHWRASAMQCWPLNSSRPKNKPDWKPNAQKPQPRRAQNGYRMSAAQKTAPQMLVALDSGATDIVVTDMPTAKAALVAYPDLKLLDFSGSDGDYKVSDEDVNIGCSMKKGNTALKTAITAVVDKMTADDFNKLMDQAISVQPMSTSN